MGWSWKLGRIAGIDVYVHATFALLLLWVALISYLPHHQLPDVWAGLVFHLVSLAIVVLHELGHARPRGATEYRLATSPCYPSAAWLGSNGCPMIPSRNCWSPWPGRRSMWCWPRFFSA